MTGPVLPRTLTFRDLLLFKLVAIVNVSLLTPSASLGRPALWLWAAAFAQALDDAVVGEGAADHEPSGMAGARARVTTRSRL